MSFLARPALIQNIGQISSGNDPSYTLIYSEINHAPKLASLLQGISAEEKLISAVQDFIFNRIKNLPNARMGKLGWNRFAFIVKLPAEECLAVAEELAQMIDNQAFDIDGVSYFPKLIIGITPLSPEYKTPERILAAIDESLFRARRTGNSMVKLIEHDDPLLHDYYDSLKLLPQITEGLKKNAFVLFSQAIVSIKNNSPEKKYEILFRFKNRQGNIDYKSRFLQAAESFQVSREVDYYVIQQFCRYYAECKPDNAMFSINISGNTIRYYPFIDMLEKEFSYFKINPEQLCFEITETVADRDYQQAIQFMNSMKNRLGCRLSMDDIGIGSSNLANLAKFNVDFMKIDGSFISNLLTDPYSELVVNFINSAAKIYGRQTIAEYVESEAQLTKLAGLGVDYAQGYLFGKPELLFDPGR